jgi:hypothetical protein
LITFTELWLSTNTSVVNPTITCRNEVGPRSMRFGRDEGVTLSGVVIDMKQATDSSAAVR